MTTEQHIQDSKPRTNILVDEYMTVHEASDFLAKTLNIRVTPDGLRKAAHQGRAPLFKCPISGKWMAGRAELAAFYRKCQLDAIRNCRH